MDKSVVRTSGIALAIIERIAFSDEPMSQAEIAAEIGMVKSAAHKHLFTLEEASWVMRNSATGRYVLGPKAWLVGQSAHYVADLAATATPLMRAVRQQTGLAVVISAMEGRSLSVIAALPGTHPIEIGVRRGSRLPLHASAQGQVALAFGAPELIETVCARKLEALTPRTITRPGALRTRVDETKRRGYGAAPEETLLGINVLAAPVFGRGGALAATVALVGSIQHLKEDPDPANVSAITILARDISSARGFEAEANA